VSLSGRRVSVHVGLPVHLLVCLDSYACICTQRSRLPMPCRCDADVNVGACSFYFTARFRFSVMSLLKHDDVLYSGLRNGTIMR
jgi:hypothetical protein